MSEHPEENNELEDQNDETLYEHHKFIAEKEYASALGQSSMAAATTKNNWRYLKNTPAHYQSELGLLKISYDQLLKNNKNNKKLMIAEEKIISLADRVKKSRIKLSNSKIESRIFDIKLLLAEIRYNL